MSVINLLTSVPTFLSTSNLSFPSALFFSRHSFLCLSQWRPPRKISNLNSRTWSGTSCPHRRNTHSLAWWFWRKATLAHPAVEPSQPRLSSNEMFQSLCEMESKFTPMYSVLPAWNPEFEFQPFFRGVPTAKAAQVSRTTPAWHHSVSV